MSDVKTNQTVTNLVDDTGNGVMDWAARHADHTTASGHGDWGRIDDSDEVPAGPAPTLTSVNPTTVSAAAGAATLTATGTNFVNGSKIRIDGVDATTTFVSATSLTTSYDPTAAGSDAITVRNPDGQTTAPQTVTVTA